jgi:hypothetical protein
MLAQPVSWYKRTSLNKLSLLIILFCFFFMAANSARSERPKLPQASLEPQRDTLSTVKQGRDLSSSCDSLLVIHFHPTVQCSCCINVGLFSRKALDRYYAKWCSSGHVVFRECNIDEDTLIAKRYNILDSALGFKKFFEKTEEFKEIESVWEFCEEHENKFILNFRKELDRFLSFPGEDSSDISEEDNKSEKSR